LNINNSEGLTFHELNRLKQWKFNRNEADIRNKTCSICLNDFMDEEALTRLPECDHLFHNECVIDWLKGHLICPYCRCDIRAALEKENPLINRVMISENLDQ
jgi:E3 ubiquitin-protein ligase ATL6/9/15/31/42/55